MDENLAEYKLAFENPHRLFFFPPWIGMRGDLFQIALICPHLITPAPMGNKYDVLYLYIVHIQDYAIKIMISNHCHITDKDTIHIYVLSAFKGLIDLLIL